MLCATKFKYNYSVCVFQTILASSFAEKDYNKVTAAATRTLQMSFVLGIGLSLAVALGLYFGASIFSKNVIVVQFIKISMPVYIHPLNSKSTKENHLKLSLLDTFSWLMCMLNSLLDTFSWLMYMLNLK